MKKIFKSFVSFLLIVITVMNLITPAFAAGFLSGGTGGSYSETSVFPKNSQLIEIKKDQAPLRSGYSNKDSIVVRGQEGAVLQVIDRKTNQHGNLWYGVNFPIRMAL